MSIDTTVLVEEASRDLADKFRSKVEKLGYNLSHGYTHINGAEPMIMVSAQYTSWKRHFYIFDSWSKLFGSERKQEKVKAIIPKVYEYKGAAYPVEVQIASMGEFL